MVAKRAAAAQAGSVAKAARQEETPFAKECASILTLLDRADGLTDATRGMLKAAAPHGLRTAVDGRHMFQDKVTGALADIFRDVESRERSTAATAESHASEAAAERGEASKADEATRDQVTAATEVRDARNAALSEAASELAAAQEALQKIRVKEAGLQTEHEQAIAERAEHQLLLSEAWGPLKAGDLANKEWRVKNKLIARVMTAMEQVGLEESLKEALPIALKYKPAERGDFANKAINFCNEELREQLESLVKKIDNHDAEVTRCAAAVVTCAEAVQAAEALHATRQGELAVAEDALLEAKQVHSAAVKKTETLRLKEKELSDVFSQAQAELESVSCLFMRFEALRKMGEEGLGKSVEAEEK